jgi:hypothetical protein
MGLILMQMTYFEIIFSIKLFQNMSFASRSNPSQAGSRASKAGQTYAEKKA